jgi:putative lipoprotein
VKLAIGLVFWSFQFGAPPERAPEPDRWFARDKAKHFVVSTVVQGAGHGLLRAGGVDYRDASFSAGVITLGVGVGKELWDRRQGSYFSWKDLTADALGGGSGAVIARQLDR